MIDLALQLDVGDAHRRFSLDLSLRTDAPVVALHGPSGAGKSLTLQAIAGLLRPRAGHVRVGGHTLFDRERGVEHATGAAAAANFAERWYASKGLQGRPGDSFTYDEI